VDIPSLSPGSHTITLKVMDIAGVWADDRTMKITVNQRPVAEIVSVSPSPAAPNETVTFTGSGSDDGTIVLFSWRSNLDGPLHEGSEPTFTSDTLREGNHSVYLRVQDDLGIWSDEVFVWLMVGEEEGPVNERPTVEITSHEDEGTVHGTVKLEGTASDMDGEVFAVELMIDGGSWINATMDEAEGTWMYSWKTNIVEDMTYRIGVRSFDGELYSEIAWINLTVDNPGGGEPGPEVPGGETESDEGFIPGFGPFPCIVGLAMGIMISNKRRG